MSGRLYRTAWAAAICLAATPLGGCILAADLLNPDALAAIGLDPGTVITPPGRVLVAFTNTTVVDAQFNLALLNATQTDGLQDAVIVAAGETGNAVYECPASVLIPGVIAAAQAQEGQLTVDRNAAVEVGLAMGVAGVAYAGSDLLSGRDFSCGDVIEIRLLQEGAGTMAQDFRIQIIIHR